jgi:hypothetical protein
MVDIPSSIQELTNKLLETQRTLLTNLARAQIEAIEFPKDKIASVFDAALTASDREAAIVIACLIDDLLIEFLRGKMTGEVPAGHKSLFKANAIFGSQDNRVSLLAAFGWITKKTLSNLTAVRKIRNEFAHNVDMRSFDDEPICNYVSNMDTHEKLILKHKPENQSLILTNRQLFLVRSPCALLHLFFDLYAFQAASHFHIDPRSILVSHDQMPKNLRDMAEVLNERAFAAIS